MCCAVGLSLSEHGAALGSVELLCMGQRGGLSFVTIHESMKQMCLMGTGSNLGVFQNRRLAVTESTTIKQAVLF